MQEPDTGQQCIFSSPSSHKEMEKCTLILHAEGKTDYCHLQAALSHFQAMGLYADLELDLTTAQAIEGHDKLFGACEALSRAKARLRNPAVFMFDRDTKDVKKVSDGSSIIRKWAPGVYSFAIPRPRHRADDRICIEMYYQDVDLRRTDREGRRLFLAKEFNNEDGSHATEEFYRLYPDRSNLVVEGKVFRKQSGVVGAENKPRKQWALAKAAFADYIVNRIPPFDHVDFRAFREIFNIFGEIVRLESVKEKDSAQTSGNARPPRRTHLLGRERELREITVHLEKSRFVTLVGCGGIGKTLLARRIYASLLDDFGDRAWFISLKDLPASDRQVSNRIPRKIASAIGIKLRQKINPLIALIDILKGNAQLNRRLFIVDNCEHLPAIGKVLSSIWQACAGVHILATSRRSLNVEGEVTYFVRPLAFPDAEAANMMTAVEAEGYSAIALFVEHAKTKESRFELNAANAAAIVQICRRLDGIPKAIELAAARVTMLTPQRLLGDLTAHFGSLLGGNLNKAPNEDTMEETLDWSYRLLHQRQRNFLRHLAIFVDSFTLDAALAVCAKSMLSGSALLRSLIDASLVNKDGQPPRFRLHEVTRQYLLEKQNKAGEGVSLGRRHLKYFCKVVRQAEAELQQTASYAAFEHLAPDLGNLRTALRWSLECGDVASGAQLAASLDWFWFALGLSNEGILRIKGFLAAAEGGDASLIAHLWTALSYLQGRIGRHKNSLESAEQAISFARATDNRLLLVRVLTDYATAKARSHLINDAEVALKEAERIAGDTPTAWQHAILLGTRGNFERLRHEFAKAIGAYTQLRVFRRSLGDKVGEGSTVLSMAEAYHANKETDKAIALIGEILGPSKLSLGRDMHANLLANIAGYLVAKDKLSDARSASCRAIQMLEASDPASAYVTWALYHLALVLALEGDSQRAAHLLGYCKHAVATVGYNVEFTERATHDRLVSLLRERCPEYQLKALRAEGEALTPREAIHEAIPT